MKTTFLHRWIIAGAACAWCVSAPGQTIEFRATINATQETPATPSPATGWAVMHYDVAANTFDLWVTINDLANPISASHIHEAPVGVAGPVVTNLGAETVYTRSGNTVTASFRGVMHGGDKLRLLQSGAYLNFHSAAFPAGEVRGQLIAQPKRLTALIDNAQEKAAFPNNTYSTNAYGAAVMVYDPATNKVNLRISLYDYANTLTASHYHEGAPGVSGPVVTNLGAGTASNYVRVGNWITGTFNDLTYTGDVVKLLTGGAYLNFHSNVYPPGEIRGQVWPSEEVPSTRLANASARGVAGGGNQVLIGGLSIAGAEPVRVLLMAKGPSLAAYGVTGALANPLLEIVNAAGRTIAGNDDFGAIAPGSEAALIPNPPAAMEAGVMLVLPPGNYSAVVSGVGGATGIALLEGFDVREIPSAPATSSAQQLIARNASGAQTGPVARLAAVAPVELCGAPAVAATR